MMLRSQLRPKIWCPYLTRQAVFFTSWSVKQLTAQPSSCGGYVEQEQARITHRLGTAEFSTVKCEV